MRRFLFTAALLLCISVSAFAQTSSISGTVADPTSALIPGVAVTATNTGTGVVSTSLTNDSGTYNFVTLPPGPYTLKAVLSGFQTATVNNISLGTAETQRFNIVLKLGSAAGTIVDVAIDAQTMLNQTSSSIAEVLSQDRVRDLPLIGGDILSLVGIMPGVDGDSFAGVGASSVNTVRDGVSVSSGRFQNGVFSTTVINPDLVGEVKIILAPVDAELGRGNGQVIITTRSGTNKYSGSVVYNITNSGLNPVSWAGNQAGNFRTTQTTATTTAGITACPVQAASDTCKWTLTNKPNWFTNHHFTGSYGGPIVPNKTFFFALWDQQKNYQRTLVSAETMSDTAKLGIFRYFDFYNNGNASQAVPTNSVNLGNAISFPVVDQNGNPVKPTWMPNGLPVVSTVNPSGVGIPYSGSMRCISVFGNVKVDGTPFTQADCPGGIAMGSAGPIATAGGGSAWDSLRPTMDPTGYIARILKEMPSPAAEGGSHANFLTGDGLNQVGYRYVRGRQGNTGAAVTTGEDTNSNRWQFNLKIDQNFSPRQKISGSWTYEKNDTSSDLVDWPGQVGYHIHRYPQVLSINMTSTLSESILNEARFGIRYANEGGEAPWEDPSQAVRDQANSWFIPAAVVNGRQYKALVAPGTGAYAFGGGANGVMINTPGQYNGNKSPLYNFSDSLRWTMGKHSFSFGAEVRLTASNGYNNIPQFPWPRVTGGTGANANALGTMSVLDPTSAAPTVNTMLATNRTNAAAMNTFLSGSITSATMLYWVEGQKDVPTQFGGTSTDPNGQWQDVTTTPPLGRKYRKTIQNEWAAFVKDDFKLTKNVTLNLGLRYEYYGSPYLGDGFTVTSVDQGGGLLGPGRPTSGNLFGTWMVPGGSLGTPGMYLAGYGTLASLTLAERQAIALTCTTTTPASQAGIATYLAPAPNCDPDRLTRPQFVGPGTNNPKLKGFPSDLNNFGPAVGFSWALPWFGEGKTQIRGGYQVTYGGSGRLVGGGGATSSEVVVGGAPGALSAATTVAGDFAALQVGRALTLVDIPALVPVRPTNPIIPGGVINVYGRSANFSAVAPDYVSPYTQNFTLSMQRTVNSRISLSINYVATVSKKQAGSLDTNTTNTYYNQEFWDALEITRRGGDALLFDQMFAGLDLHGTVTTGVTGYGVVGSMSTPIINGVSTGVPQLNRGSAHLRRNATFSGDLANGNFVNIAENLNTLSNVSAGALQAMGTGTLPGVSGKVLRNGCDRLGNGIANIGVGALAVPNRCFAENFLTMNPQLGTPTYIANLGSSNYHSLQTSISLRPKQGISYTANWSFTKQLSTPGNGYKDFRDMHQNYSDNNSRQSDFRSNGSFELPIGPNKMLLGNSSGLIARLVERWQMNIIYNVQSGTLGNVTATTGMYNTFVPDIVGPFPYTGGSVAWNGPKGNGPDGAGTGTPASGSYFGRRNIFTHVPDPQCSLFKATGTDTFGYNLFTNFGNVTNGACTLVALADAATGQVVLQNAMPGTNGSYGTDHMRGVGNWSLNGNLGKTFRISESKSLQVRVDANNVFNHPTPGGPSLTIGGTADFGQITTKSGNRSFQGQLRFSF